MTAGGDQDSARSLPGGECTDVEADSGPIADGAVTAPVAQSEVVVLLGEQRAANGDDHRHLFSAEDASLALLRRNLGRNLGVIM